MEAFLSLLNSDVVLKFSLLFARVASFVAFMPVFGHTGISPTIRVAFAFYLVIFLFPFVGDIKYVSDVHFLKSILAEISLGLVAAMLFNVILSSVRVIGELIEYSTALSMAMMFDPATGSQQGLISKLLYWIALVLFFQSGLYETTLVMLAKSFSMVHLGAFDLFSFDGITMAIGEVNRMFAFAFTFALPLFFIGFIMDVYYGYGTKSMPAFSPFIITFQLKIILIFSFLIFGLEVLNESLVNYFINSFE
ncbi:flagellar biosynthetic protein FliR [Arcobacter porcinus]|uniref:Flagellar biosynthesis protein FliR n=1 Tax=Arcobacter porcinus TaxID=1935204 RepID=A0A1C0B154_9BACT|nr:flagellar biosynthetic protein FliR [Arcobacter porcinus]OCL89531.1 flagellar biosynthesis protein FliR [Aliarcobacter thereius]OCL82948.1 flagellar biosynthesis protein FliR [Arcobacter porcinus]OCL84423.1 flagellar biosynthesis protein FliR [Arcobacter porcinus]OCL88964.1 flagellar biosynthesis protein FliR [Arcobacter porcinus]OCL93594.1 flagellar biosynthesis protein FliR [Arcobacter porcinus]